MASEVSTQGKERTLMGNNTVWTIVGVLLIIVLVFYLI
ncbi:hypothetical protein BH20ACT15_BH20ACT15_15460 [soil metagenome]